jgi:uncharacterized phiE125 gp8 family phage protein
MAQLCPLALDISPITQLPLTMEVVRQHCHIDDDEMAPQVDTLLGIYLRAAVYWFEGETHRSIVARTHRWSLAEFPYAGDLVIRLPRGKTQAVTSIVYGSSVMTGPSASPPGSDFQQSLLGDDGGILLPASGGIWPTADPLAVAPITITFTAGYTVNEIPEDIKEALLFYCSDAFELRGTSDLDVAGRNLKTRSSIISPYILSRWY